MNDDDEAGHRTWGAVELEEAPSDLMGTGISVGGDLQLPSWHPSPNPIPIQGVNRSLIGGVDVQRTEPTARDLWVSYIAVEMALITATEHIRCAG